MNVRNALQIGTSSGRGSTIECMKKRQIGDNLYFICEMFDEKEER